MASVTWKSAEILKVYGTTIREGVYTGSKVDVASGKIAPDLPTEFTPAKIAKIYENINTHVPIYLGHSTDPGRKPIGFAYKFGVTETLDDIKYSGFIFDKDAIHKIVAMGYDKVSPEISDNEDELKAIAFVPNPAIEGTDAELELKVFNKPQTEITTMPETQATTNVTTQEQAQVTRNDVQEHVPIKSVPNTRDYVQYTPVQRPVVEQPASVPDQYKEQVEEFRSKYEQANARIEALLTQQYDQLVSEMKGLGIPDPGSIVHGLPTEQKIAVLSKMKETVLMSKPLAVPSTSETPKATDTTAVLDEVLKEIGISKEEYDKLSSRRK